MLLTFKTKSSISTALIISFFSLYSIPSSTVKYFDKSLSVKIFTLSKLNNKSSLIFTKLLTGVYLEISSLFLIFSLILDALTIVSTLTLSWKSLVLLIVTAVILKLFLIIALIYEIPSKSFGEETLVLSTLDNAVG